ncbi:AAA domain-containing protein [Pseudoxanthomonas putridarboris]|uniref:AAA domain-containing protein n=1 Tax=Pseudoxanthomonas putridarboris TaxID=752605 RepID=A0ABU9IYG9_9GAMM
MSGSNELPAQPGTLRLLIDVQAGAALATDDVLVLVLPLFEQVAALHAEGRVAALDPGAIMLGESGALRLRQPAGQAPAMDIDAVHRVQPHPASTLNIVGELRRAHQADGIERLSDLEVQTDASAPIERPVYLPGFGSWEIQIGHHDEITDIFRLGLVLAALACGLDFDDADDVQQFAAHRRNLFQLTERLNPIVAAVIVEMTAVNRHDRATDLAGLATRLRTWREQPEALDVERALAGAIGVAPRRAAVLSHLRDRLFDLSRRNRLLYFRPTASSVNLTVSSVPLILQLESIRPEHICTWGGPFAADLVAGRAVDLRRCLRFDDQPYLPVALDRLIQETRRDRAEYGFSHLRLVAAFLRWHNLKESPDERITTPLLWLPAELVRRKGVRDQYVIQCEDGEAEFNPVLRHYLRQLYDIRLPETVDLQKTSIAEIHADLLAQIRRTEPSVELRLVEKAQIKLVRQKALQRMQQFQRRRAPSHMARDGASAPPDYSYERGDYRPLGRALFERWVRPSLLPQRFEAGAAPVAGPRHARMMADPVAEADERIGYELQESEGHRYAWDLDLTHVSLANFNYKKMSLVRDYAQLLEQPAANPAFDRVFSIEPREVETAPPVPVPLPEQWNVIASDATQNAAVGLARSQRSFIIQGPPGTGKSQTITNLIADYAGRGKRVLFVCEKRAALDVVFHRLKQSGLGELCCLIHDSQTDKKAFIADLRGCYERWIAQPHGSDELSVRRDHVLAALDGQRQRIERFEQAMSNVSEALGTSVRLLVRRLAALPPPPELGPAARERLPTLSAWDRHRDLTQRVHRGLRERFGLHSLATHPFARLSPQLVGDEHAYARAERLLDECGAWLDRLDPVLDDATRLLDHDLLLDDALAIAAEARWLLDQSLAGHLDLLDDASPAAVELRRMRDDMDQRLDTLAQAVSATSHWRDKLSADDTQSALELMRRLEGSALRWLQPQWWRLRGELKRRYDFGRHAVHPGYSKVLLALAEEHAAAAAVAESDLAGRKRYGVPDMQGFLRALSELRQRTAAPGATRALLDHLGRSADAIAAAQGEAAAGEPLEKLARRIRDDLSFSGTATLGDIAELLRDLREGLDDLPDLLPLLRAVHAADPAYAAALRELPYAPEPMEALVAGEALKRLEREAPELARFDGVALARSTRAIAEGQQRLLEINACVVAATLHRLFTEHVRQSSLSATQLDAVGKEFKKLYSTGRRELEHEFGKSMRYRSIRDLAGDETGLVINDLKPIWLMSPLSVSDTLPLSPELFDVVIFDEASQIPTEEAVPALSRARQVVVVGDEMQLPPTSFFSAGADGEDEIVVEEEGERIAINLDSDSLLNQAARNLPATLLAWHYRSRHESLISFSNAAFYDGRLVTIPDRRRERSDADAAALRSDQADAGVAGAGALLRRAVSFHHLADGVYAGRRNAAEARYIAQMVRELLRRETGLSIGIVAFSEAQQDEIETALAALAGEDADFALRLEREFVREDDDQFNGLFVKNLENVQGDERDVIILSICYAPGPDGRMLMNFGPINQRGGEKRLNVIFSRARHRMAVVSTIQAEAITNMHNDGAAALRAFLQFAQASAHGDFERTQHVLGTLNPGARNVFTREASSDAIRQALADALRQRGHEVHEHVGRSQFRCDLAIVDPAGDAYALAVLLDAPDAPVADTGERYVFRPGILRSFGWRVVDVPGQDWVRDAEAVLARIEAALNGGDEPDGDEPDAEWEAARVDTAPRHPIASGPAAGPAEAAGSAPDRTIVVRRFRFEQGTSRKFWRVALAGAELTVTFGRIGSSGQSNIKVFDTADRAEREMEKLVAEKLRKGYSEE